MADSIVAPYGLETNNPQPEIKRYYNLAKTPYTNTAQVLSEVLLAVRYKGQTFNVNEEEWWFKDGVADGDLVLKLSALSSNLTDGQELDLPYIGSNIFTLPDNYSIVSVFINIALNKKVRYTRSGNTITILETLETGDVVNIRGLVATGSFTPVTPPNLDDVTSQGSLTSVPIQSPNAVNANELASLGQVQGLIGAIVIPNPSFEDVLQVNRTATTSPLIPNATEPTGAVNLQQLDTKQTKKAIITNATVSGTYNLDASLTDTYNLTLTGNTTLALINTSSTFAEPMTVYITGNFSLAYPAGSTIIGIYRGNMKNQLVIEKIGSVIYITVNNYV